MGVDLEEILRSSRSRWMDGSGAASDVVISTRIRLARNLEAYPFPQKLDRSQADAVIGAVSRAVEDLNRRGTWGELRLFLLRSLSRLDRVVLVEKHLISPQHANSEDGAVVLRADEAISIMVNEEDHIRLQCLSSGLDLESTWKMADGVDDDLEATLGVAFCSKKGYLTACPTNVGTGLRASVMAHLPALVVTRKIGEIIPAITKLGFVVRGMYGEGTEAAGNLFQVSNQVSLGHSEEEILDGLKGVTMQIVQHERNDREKLLKEDRMAFEDRVGRAYGLLANARVLTSDEALKLWSDVKLGVEVGVLPGIRGADLNELIVLTRPGFVSKKAGRELSPSERDVLRAEAVRAHMRRISNL